MRELGYGEFVNHKKNYKNYFLVEEKDDVYKYDRHTKRKELVRLSALNMLEKYRKSIGITD